MTAPVIRDKIRFAGKRLRSLVHDRRGYATIEVAGNTVQFRTESALQTEHTRYNAASERDVTAAMLDDVDGERVLDVGAGHGIEACLAAVAGASHVTAIDADPDRAAYITANARRNTVADTIDTRVIRVGTTGHATRLDDLNITPSVIKMDIEGSEWDALQSAPVTLQHAHRIGVETHPSMLPDGVTTSDIAGLLERAGFEVSQQSVRNQPFLIGVSDK